MSRVLPLIVGSGASTVATSLTAVLSKVAGASVELKVDSKFGSSTASPVGLAAGLSSDELTNVVRNIKAHTSITKSTGIAEASPNYHVNNIVVRALSGHDGNAIALRDRVDVFASNGIDAKAEYQALTQSFSKTVKVAVEAAKKGNTPKITAYVKPATKFQQLNAAFADAAKGTAEAAGVSVDFTNSQQVHNSLVMFPENVPVIVAPDSAPSDVLEDLAQGLFGGSGAVPRVFVGDTHTVYSANGIASAVLALGLALRCLGLATEAAKVDAAVKKALTTVKPKGVDNGTADDATFTKAVVAAL